MTIIKALGLSCLLNLTLALPSLSFTLVELKDTLNKLQPGEVLVINELDCGPISVQSASELDVLQGQGEVKVYTLARAIELSLTEPLFVSKKGQACLIPISEGTLQVVSGYK